MFARHIQPRYPSMRLGLTTFFVVAPAAFFAFTRGFTLLTFGVGMENDAQVALNGVLVAVLGASYVAWSLALSRRWVGETSGAGFVLMGYALAARIYCEFMLILPGDFVGFEHADLGTEVRAFRATALFAYAFGLATIATSVWTTFRRRTGR